MPHSQSASIGSNTNYKAGPGQVYGITIAAPNGASVAVVDSVSIGATPNYVTQASNGSNVAFIGPLTAAANFHIPLYGARFEVGLTVAATSSANVTVNWD